MGATAGDLQARDVAREWLDRSGVPHDVACAPVFDAGVDWRTVEPAVYTHVLVVCGPFDPDREPIAGLLERFAGTRLVGLDVSVERPLAECDPFDLLFERDSSRGGAPDLAFAAPAARMPAVGVVLAPHQREYGERARHAEAEALIDRALGVRAVARVDLDTALNNEPGSRDPASLRSPAEVESLVAPADAVVTTRLHGLVLALKAGVPAVAVDPVAGGRRCSARPSGSGGPTPDPPTRPTRAGSATRSTAALIPPPLREPAPARRGRPVRWPPWASASFSPCGPRPNAGPEKPYPPGPSRP